MTIFMTFHFLIELLRNKTLSPNFDLLINNKPSFCLYIRFIDLVTVLNCWILFTAGSLVSSVFWQKRSSTDLIHMNVTFEEFSGRS